MNDQQRMSVTTYFVSDEDLDLYRWLNMAAAERDRSLSSMIRLCLAEVRHTLEREVVPDGVNPHDYKK